MKEKRSLIANIRIMSLDNCMSNSMAWYAEKAYRHYSTRYHTPLHEARSLLTSLEAILIFMEDEVEDLAIEELQEIRSKLIEASNNRVFTGSASDDEPTDVVSDDDWVAMQDKLVKEQEAKAKKSKESELETTTKKLGAAATTLADVLKAVQNKIGRDIEADVDKPLTFEPEK